MTTLLVLMAGLLLSNVCVCAELQVIAPSMKKIMVVDFELRDVSPIPNVSQEVERTKLIDSVIRKMLSNTGYQLVLACNELRKASEQGDGYLYDRPEIAGEIGGRCGADYVLMGQTWKPSFLFVFPQVQVVNTRKNLTREQLVVVSRVVQLEASTSDKNATEAAGINLAIQIMEKLKSIHE